MSDNLVSCLSHLVVPDASLETPVTLASPSLKRRWAPPRVISPTAVFETSKALPTYTDTHNYTSNPIGVS